MNPGQPPQRRQQGRRALDLIEEATHLLRTAAPATLAVYFLGTIPFVLGLLFFWADMSRSPLAPQHLAAGSLGMTALFFWMKFWQVSYARRLRAQAANEPLAPLAPRACARIFFHQAVIQPFGLLLLPLTLVLVPAFPWVLAYYQNVTALDDGGAAGTGPLAQNSRRQALLWTRQNQVVVAIMLAFALCVFLNWLTVCLTLPQLAKTLLGLDSMFIRSPWAMLNTTFFAAMAGLTYLSIDPVLKAIYALRCFYGESLQSGGDLKAELKPFAPTALKTAATVLIFLACFSTPSARAATNGPAGPVVGQSLPPPDLDHAIGQTIHEQKYQWRLPREKAQPKAADEPDAKPGVIAQFFEKIGDLIRDWGAKFYHWLEKILGKLTPPSRPPTPGTSTGNSYGSILFLQMLLYVLAAAVILALGFLLYRLWRNRGARPNTALTGEAIQILPDVADENVRADQLPEDGWASLARDLLARGEFRLAMRAYYLAALAQLAARNLISIARFKSNRDYERELRRRAHAFPHLSAAFGDCLLIFERTWYGLHAADRELVGQFAASLERLKGE